MKAIILNEAGSIDNLQFVDIAKPTIKNNEVLVKTISLSINPVDYKVRANDGALNWILGADRPAIIGWDLSGTVVKVGDAVTDFKIGDAVFGMANFPGKGNAYAEFVAVPSAQLTLKPTNISHQEAASATLAALTAWQTLVEKGNVKKGDKVLIHAASGGVGHYTTQIAKHLGAYVIGTSSAKNREFVLQNGADKHIDYTTENFQDKVSDVDFVLDTIGGDTILKSLDITKQGGTIVSIASSNLSNEELEKAKSKDVNLSFLLVQSSGENMFQIAQLMERGILKSHVSKTFSFDEMGG
ncbi:MAG TPA: NADP-dependent oxidoreductase [Arachidicoccus soli]|nr:NADP-dependent oxidoreductase [Arachidicoccus soli]